MAVTGRRWTVTSANLRSSGGVVFAVLGVGDVFSGVVVLLLVGVFVAVYTVVLSAVGGVLGVYLAKEFRN